MPQKGGEMERVVEKAGPFGSFSQGGEEGPLGGRVADAVIHGHPGAIHDILDAVIPRVLHRLQTLPLWLIWVVVAVSLLFLSRSKGGFLDRTVVRPLEKKYHWLLVLLNLTSKHKGEIVFPVEFNKDEIEFNVFTQAYRAVMRKAMQSKDAWWLREIAYSYYSNTVYQDMKESLFFLRQEQPVLIDEGIYAKYTYEIENVPSRYSKGEVRCEKHHLSIYSDSITRYQLQKKLDQWVQEFKEEKNAEIAGKSLIFQVRPILPETKDDDNDNDNRDEEQKKREKSMGKIIYLPFHSYRSFNNLFFEGKEKVLSEIDAFLCDDRSWFKKNGLNDTLGILCHGPPGCGKTSFIKALLQYTGRHAVIFSVNKQTKLQQIERVMHSEMLLDFTIPQNKRIYVLEDIDAMGDLVCRRKKKTAKKSTISSLLPPFPNKKGGKKKPVSPFEFDELDSMTMMLKSLKKRMERDSEEHLAFFLNILDGLTEMPGRIIVMTTNHIEKLDPALLRFGRVDIQLAFKHCSRRILKEIACHFYKKSADSWEVPEVLHDYDLSPATVARICRAHKHSFKDFLVELESEGNKMRELEEERSRRPPPSEGEEEDEEEESNSDSDGISQEERDVKVDAGTSDEEKEKEKDKDCVSKEDVEEQGLV